MIRIDKTQTLRDLRRLAEEAPKVAARGLYEGAELAFESARTTATFKDHNSTKGLRASIRLNVRGELSFIVVADKAYAEWVEENTDPHTIAAKKAKFLRFQIGGRWISKKSVQHPGTTGKHFMKTARDLGEAAVIAVIERELGTLFR